MKKIELFSLALIILAFAFACNKDKGSNIIGTWKISDVSSTTEIPAELKANYKETIDEMKSSSLLVIKADSTFENTLSESTSTGKWKVSPDQKTLTLTYGDGGTEVSNIIELSEKKMILSLEINDYKNTISYEKQPEK